MISWQNLPFLRQNKIIKRLVFLVKGVLKVNFPRSKKLMNIRTKQSRPAPGIRVLGNPYHCESSIGDVCTHLSDPYSLGSAAVLSLNQLSVCYLHFLLSFGIPLNISPQLDYGMIAPMCKANLPSRPWPPYS